MIPIRGKIIRMGTMVVENEEVVGVFVGCHPSEIRHTSLRMYQDVAINVPMADIIREALLTHKGPPLEIAPEKG